MTRWLAVAWLGTGVCMFTACGSDNKGGSGTVSDPVSGCKAANIVICKKVFACFSKDELDARKTTVGLNADDCATRYDAECTPEKVNCNAGETYHADKDQKCTDDFSAYTCTDFLGYAAEPPTTPAPAACSQICTK